MEQQLPGTLQVALYAASLAVVVIVSALCWALFHFRKQLERLVRAVEEVKAEITPLAHETRLLVSRLHDLSGRIQGQWSEVEEIIETTRHWSERANHVVEGILAITTLPVLAATDGIRRLLRGFGVFVQVLLNRKQLLDHQKARES